LDRTPLDQAMAQLAALGITIAFAVIVGWLTGTGWNYLNEVIFELSNNVIVINFLFIKLRFFVLNL
jgi:hypothetical protein